jgi:hypothetical protein
MNQRQRVVGAVFHLAVLLGTSSILFGTALPDLGSEGAWFYAGLAMLLLSVALTEPFFARPADALVNGVAAVLVAATYSTTVGKGTGASSTAIEYGKLAAAAYGVVIASIATAAILTKDGRFAAFSDRVSHACRVLGSGKVIYSAIFLASVYAAYSREPHVLATLTIVWILIAIVRPGDYAARVFLAAPTEDRSIGRVVGLSNPGLVEIHAPASKTLSTGDAVRFASSTARGVILDTASTEDGLWALVSVIGQSLPAIGDRAIWADDTEDAGRMLGVVEPGTNIQAIRLRAPGDVARVREGSVVQLKMRERDVAYQIVAAAIQRQALSSPIEHRYLEITARKIGEWVGNENRFRSVPWLPQAGAPTYFVTSDSEGVNPEYVGVVPDTDYGVVANPDLLVTHNTAILGILGIGKTYLTWELIRRVLLAGTKVVVLDITGEYAPEFQDVTSPDEDTKIRETINAAIAANRWRVKQNVHEGGNLLDFRKEIRKDIDAFVEGPSRLRIYNPAQFDVVRQDSKPYQGAASMAPLTVAEVTRWIAEELLSALSSEIVTSARVCLVLEEAHALVPEWNSTSYEGDQRASIGTARAVLQGRKYGLGVILVTQRTANVTKTILNQCNTVFALRTFDATGMEFLRNYVGAEYTDVLSALEVRTAVVFGKASSCEMPLIIGLNDRGQMLDSLWKPGFAGLVESEPENDDLLTEEEANYLDYFEPAWGHVEMGWGIPPLGDEEPPNDQ